jgi:hypothetical protein
VPSPPSISSHPTVPSPSISSHPSIATVSTFSPSINSNSNVTTSKSSSSDGIFSMSIIIGVIVGALCLLLLLIGAALRCYFNQSKLAEEMEAWVAADDERSNVTILKSSKKKPVSYEHKFDHAQSVNENSETNNPFFRVVPKASQMNNSKPPPANNSYLKRLSNRISQTFNPRKLSSVETPL